MARMNDYEYELMQENRDRAITARSARRTRTHCGKAGAVRFPHDKLTKKELKAMSGECIKYASLKKPMSWKDFKKLPEDLQKEYIRWIRNKFGTPDSHIAQMFDIAKGTLSGHLKKLGIDQGSGGHGNGRKTWNSVGFHDWIYEGVDPDEKPVSDTVKEASCYSSSVSDVEAKGFLQPLCAARELLEEHRPKPSIPAKGSMTFENSCVRDVATVLESVLQDARLNITVIWGVSGEQTKED